MQEKLYYKIKKKILPDFNVEEDFDLVLKKIIRLSEILALIVFSIIVLFDLFYPFNEYSTIYFIFGFSLSLYLKLTNPKNFNVSVNLYIFLLYTVCIFSNIFETYFYIYYLCLIFYISVFKRIKISALHLLLTIIIIIFIANFFPSTNSGKVDVLFNVVFPRTILIYTLISISTILLSNEIIKLLKIKVDLTYKQSGELNSKEKEQEELIIQLRNEAEEREKIQKKLEFSKFRYKTIFDNVLDYIVIHKKDGQIVGANSAAIEKYGFDKDNLFNYNKYDFISEKYLNLKDERIDLAIEKESLIFESEHIDKNGNFFYTDNKLKVVVLDNEEFFVTICRDITDRKIKEKNDEEIKNQLEQKVIDRTAQLEDAMGELRNEIQNKNKIENDLMKAKDELLNSLEIEKEFSKLKTRFVSMISHEYRTPLTVILSTTYILENYFKTQDEEKFSNGIYKIQKSVQAMTTLLEDVLKVGKSENDISLVSFNNVDIIDLAKEIVKKIKFIDKTNHNFKCVCNYKSLIISTDKKLMDHILSNIIQNATKYSEKNTTITMSLEVENSLMKIIIKDEGIGIPEEDKIHLFEPFFRSGNVGAIEGTGLGLSIVKQYVNALNGKIEVESEQNKGTTFHLTFPIKSYSVEE